MGGPVHNFEVYCQVTARASHTSLVDSQPTSGPASSGQLRPGQAPPQQPPAPASWQSVHRRHSSQPARTFGACVQAGQLGECLGLNALPLAAPRHPGMHIEQGRPEGPDLCGQVS